MFTISEIVNFIFINICSDDYNNFNYALIWSIIDCMACLIGLILSKKY